MALNRKSNHLFVAELGNGSVDDVDLTSGSVAGRISGLHEPQGVAWLPTQDEVAVACGDGSVRFYRTADRREVARVSLGDDADNVRVDNRNGNLVVGFGSGALAVIEPSTHRVIRELKLPAHPEGFEILGSHAFVNLPAARAIVIGDIDQGVATKTLGTGTRFGNYPMVSDAARSRLAVAFRLPSSLSVFDGASGGALFSTSICGDADDLYFRSGQLVVVCGSGVVELVATTGAHRASNIATAHGARTGLFDAAADRLFVAVPAGQRPAAIWELSFQ